MLAILTDAFVKATVLLVLAAVVTIFLRRSPASLRHLVRTLACSGVLALHLASALLPNWKLALWPRLDVPVAFNAEQLAPRAAEPEPQPAARVVPTVHAPTPSPSSTIDAEPVRWHRTPDWTALVFPVWLSGVGAVLILLAVGSARAPATITCCARVPPRPRTPRICSTSRAASAPRARLRSPASRWLGPRSSRRD